MHLRSPWRPLRLADNETFTTSIVGFIEGEVPPDLAQNHDGSRPPGLRLLTASSDPAADPEHIDVTSGKAAAMLDGFLRNQVIQGKQVTFAAHGTGKRRRPSIRIRTIL